MGQGYFNENYFSMIALQFHEVLPRTVAVLAVALMFTNVHSANLIICSVLCHDIYIYLVGSLMESPQKFILYTGGSISKCMCERFF